MSAKRARPPPRSGSWAGAGRPVTQFRRGGFAPGGATLRRFGVLKGRAATAGTELKFHDIDANQAVADLSAGIILNTSSVSLIGQGVTESTRVGRKCVVHQVAWRGTLELAVSAGAGVQTPQTTRLMLVLDKQCNGAAPAVTGNGGVLESADYLSFNNLSNKGRFRVLSDDVYDLNPMSSAGDGAVNDTSAVRQHFAVYKAVNIPLEFSGVANPSVIAEVRTNNIFCLMITNNATAVTSLDSKIRLRFSDA